MNKVTIRIVIATLLLGLGVVWAQQDPNAGQQPAGSNPSAPVTLPDNTKNNQRDRSKSEPTADQQKNNKSDRELARQIRRALVKDKSLSTYAHNIKVIAQDGMVTLKGPVHTAAEKQAIEAKAAEVAGGADKVKSEIEVGSKQASKKPSPGKMANQ
jgi:hyperosmotically inducible periplasmic protein